MCSSGCRGSVFQDIKHFSAFRFKVFPQFTHAALVNFEFCIANVALSVSLTHCNLLQGVTSHCLSVNMHSQVPKLGTD